MKRTNGSNIKQTLAFIWLNFDGCWPETKKGSRNCVLWGFGGTLDAVEAGARGENLRFYAKLQQFWRAARESWTDSSFHTCPRGKQPKSRLTEFDKHRLQHKSSTQEYKEDTIVNYIVLTQMSSQGSSCVGLNYY